MYMLMDNTCPDHFNTNGPNILSPIKVPPMPCSHSFAGSSHLLSPSILPCIICCHCLPRVAASLHTIMMRHQEQIFRFVRKGQVPSTISTIFLQGTISQLGRMLSVHAQVNGDYTTPPLSKGTYTYACQVPGHWYVLAWPDACFLCHASQHSSFQHELLTTLRDEDLLSERPMGWQDGPSNMHLARSIFHSINVNVVMLDQFYLAKCLWSYKVIGTADLALAWLSMLSKQ